MPRQHGLFQHHGIDLGDSSVAHYLEGREILRSPIEAFSRGQPVSVVAYEHGSCSTPGVTLRRAMGRLGEQNYNLLFNNCEHFAHWCKTGRHRSRQVESLLELPAALLHSAKSMATERMGQTLREALNHGLDQLDPELIQRSLSQLESLHQRLQNRLEGALRRAEARWGESQFEPLRLAAQGLADQLAEVEELERAIEAQLQRRLGSGQSQ